MPDAAAVLPSVSAGFNPHSRKGSDFSSADNFAVDAFVSIHTPARGVTQIFQVCRKLRAVSIHTPARGVTRDIAELVDVIKFQSTLPQGE